MQVHIKRRKSEFIDFIDIPELTLTSHQCDERTPTSLISPVGNMGLIGVKKCAYSHT